MPLNRVPESRPHDVGVNLGGRDVGVPQHDLHAPQVGAALQEVGGEAVAEDVGREAVEDAGLLAVLRQVDPEGLAGEWAAAGGDEEIAAGAVLEDGGAALL